MLSRKLVVAAIVGAFFVTTSASEADAGGLLKRLFGKRCHQAQTCTKTCQPSCQRAPCAAPAPCATSSAPCGVSSMELVGKAGLPCFGDNINFGNCCCCKLQYWDDYRCCGEKFPDNPTLRKACRNYAKKVAFKDCLRGRAARQRMVECDPHCEEPDFNCYEEFEDPEEIAQCIAQREYPCLVCLECRDECDDCTSSFCRYDCDKCEHCDECEAKEPPENCEGACANCMHCQ